MIYSDDTPSPVLSPRILPLAYSIPATLIFVAPRTHQPYFHLGTFAFILTTWNTLPQITTWLTLSFLLVSAQISAYHSDFSFLPYRKPPPPQPLP